MTNVADLDVITSLDIPAERIIRAAGNAGLEQAVVVGWQEDGSFYFASSYASGAEVVYLLEMEKKKLLEIGDK